MAAQPPRRGRRDDDLRHPRPGGGDGRRRADRRHEGRRDRAGRRPRASSTRSRRRSSSWSSSARSTASAAPTCARTTSTSRCCRPTAATRSWSSASATSASRSRVELALAGGGTVWAQVTRAEAEQLELAAGPDHLGPPAHAKVFENGAPTEELQASDGASPDPWAVRTPSAASRSGGSGARPTPRARRDRGSGQPRRVR